MITDHIKNNYFELIYKYYEYDTPQTISVEYARYKYFKKLTNHFVKSFKIDITKYQYPLSNLILEGISKNKNMHDPVFIIFDTETFIQMYEKEASVFQESQIKSIIDALNNKVLKYINKLKSIEDTRKLNKLTEEGNILLEIEDRSNTRIILKELLYDKICDRYKEHNQDNFNINFVDKLIWSTLFRQKYLGILDKWQGSINKEELDYLHDKYHVNVELFASLINATLKYYGSLFYDIEKYFGSIGNFFNCTLVHGFFQMNPPTILWMLEDSFKHVREMLDKTTDLTLYITTAVWDIYDRAKLNKYCNTDKPTDYPNPKLGTLKRTKYIIFDHLYCRNVYKFVDYVGTKRNINLLQINVLVVSNKYKKDEIVLPFLPDKYVEST